MARPAPTSIADHFRRLPDPRVCRTRRHALDAILVITLCAVICGADDWVAIARFGRAKRKWFRGFLTLRHGIPSHDTFGRVFAALDPEAFTTAFLAWVQTLATLLPGEVIAGDGKTLRRTFDTAGDKAAIHMVSAWATAQGLCLGQIKTDAKSNEITAIPKLLELLALAGRIVTIDAMGCQTAIARTIHAKGGDDVLSFKGNRPASTTTSAPSAPTRKPAPSATCPTRPPKLSMATTAGSKSAAPGPPRTSPGWRTAGAGRGCAASCAWVWIEASPATRIPEPGEERSRDRVLSDDELRELWASLELLAKQVEPADDGEDAKGDREKKPHITPATAQAFQVQLLTAQRPGEVRSMRWADVDLEKGWWSIPGAVAKNGQAHRVPLTKAVVDILKPRLKAAGERAIFVFENRRGAGSVAHRGKKAASVLCKSLTFEFRAHDLRRTAATRMAEAGVPRDHIAKVLNHVEGGPAATRVYDRYDYDAEKRDALGRWARRLAAIVEGKTKKVVPIRA